MCHMKEYDDFTDPRTGKKDKSQQETVEAAFWERFPTTAKSEKDAD